METSNRRHRSTCTPPSSAPRENSACRASPRWMAHGKSIVSDKRSSRNPVRIDTRNKSSGVSTACEAIRRTVQTAAACSRARVKVIVVPSPPYRHPGHEPTDGDGNRSERGDGESSVLWSLWGDRSKSISGYLTSPSHLQLSIVARIYTIEKSCWGLHAWQSEKGKGKGVTS